MVSVQHITKGTAVALVAGAFAAPVAPAGAIGAPAGAIGGYSRQDKQLTPSTQSRHVAAGDPFARRAESWQSRSIAGYSRQDKQLTPSTQPAPLRTSRPVLQPWAPPGAGAFLAATAARSHAVAPATGPGENFDWGDAGIGAAGGLVLSIVAIGGGLVLVRRRPRRTGPTAVATG